MEQALWWTIAVVLGIPVAWIFLYGVGKALGLGWHQSKLDILHKRKINILKENGNE